MSKHEEKKCPGCNATFECKVGDVLKCQCYGIELSPVQEAYVRANFTDCICRNCLLRVQQFQLPTQDAG